MVRGVLAALVFAAMAAVLTGVLVYRWQESRFVKLLSAEREAAASDIRDLEQQLADCSTALADVGWPFAGSGSFVCGELNADPPNTKVAYYDDFYGIAFALPFNSSWGYGIQKPEPYISISEVEGILFGPPREIGECQWAHTMQLTFLPRRSETELYEDVLARNAARVEAGEITEEGVIPEHQLMKGAYDAYRYVVPGECLLVNYELVGQRYHYIFSVCEGQEDMLMQVVESVELSSTGSGIGA